MNNTRIMQAFSSSESVTLYLLHEKPRLSTPYEKPLLSMQVHVSYLPSSLLRQSLDHRIYLVLYPSSFHTLTVALCGTESTCSLVSVLFCLFQARLTLKSSYSF